MVDQFMKSLDVIQNYSNNKNLMPGNDYFKAKKTLKPFIDLGAIVLKENTFENIEKRIQRN